MSIIEMASGATIRKNDLLKKNEYNIIDFGASESKSAVENTRIINEVIMKVCKNNGGTVVIPKGRFHVYTIVLKSNVNLRFDKGAILVAARTDIKQAYEKQVGEGGNYLEPEVNLYAGLQDHGHTYFSNSLIYAKDEENVMIYGEGLIDGSYIDEETGYRRYTLLGGDPLEPLNRTENGHKGEWFGNKGIALVNCRNVVLADFSFVIGGHFAIITEGVINMYVDHILVDTTRDAFDIDCCEKVTVVNSTFNSLTDDALVVKASYGVGKFMPSKDILIENCTVSGYDAGSVYAGLYSCDKLIATDSCGPTGRVKLGTESTCGYEKITVRNVTFKRSRGFALEAVDGSNLKDIIFENCQMDQVSSSPIFLRVGDRGRFPVTGNSEKQLIVADSSNIRLDNRNWVLPCTDEYQNWPIQRYVPSYNKDYEVMIDEYTKFSIVNQNEPAKVNESNLSNAILKNEREKYEYANACGCKNIAKMSNILIRNVVITNADPRYPILIMGLVDSKISNVKVENVSVTYRGGLSLEHATEQRQMFTNWEYTQYETKSSIQSLPWLVNPFFLKEEGLLPRVDWDKEENSWKDNPYNIPELPNVYPEPSNWGILPAYGIYARHVENIHFKNIAIKTLVPDSRHVLVLDDANEVTIEHVQVNQNDTITPKIALVENQYKRHTNKEYIMNEPYFTTRVENVKMITEGQEELSESDMIAICVQAPAPGTPNDAFYKYPTVPIPQNGYQYAIKTDEYPLPLTVYRPFISAVSPIKIKRGSLIDIPIVLRDPVSQVAKESADKHIYNEIRNDEIHTVEGMERKCYIKLASSFAGASYDMKKSRFKWDTSSIEEGIYDILFTIDDSIILEEHHISITVY